MGKKPRPPGKPVVKEKHDIDNRKLEKAGTERIKRPPGKTGE
jgi:hypothetical protein